MTHTDWLCANISITPPHRNLYVVRLPGPHQQYLPVQTFCPFFEDVFRRNWEMRRRQAAGVGSEVTFADCFGRETTWFHFMDGRRACIEIECDRDNKTCARGLVRFECMRIQYNSQITFLPALSELQFHCLLYTSPSPRDRG